MNRYSLRRTRRERTHQDRSADQHEKTRPATKTTNGHPRRSKAAPFPLKAGTKKKRLIVTAKGRTPNGKKDRHRKEEERLDLGIVPSRPDLLSPQYARPISAHNSPFQPRHTACIYSLLGWLDFVYSAAFTRYCSIYICCGWATVPHSSAKSTPSVAWPLPYPAYRAVSSAAVGAIAA